MNNRYDPYLREKPSLPQFRLRPLSRTIAMALALAAAPTAFGQDDTDVLIEEVVVTGSFIKGNSEQMAVPVEVMDRSNMIDQGMPNTTEMILKMPWMSGTVNQSEQFQSNGEQTGTKNVNIRGLGRGRTLVLLNDKRIVGIGPSNTQGDAPVDIGNFPSIAMGRIELLKNGGSTLYGSDAIAGVFNYKTRGDFEGLELTLGASDIDGAGDSDLGLIWGMQTDNFSLVASFEFDERTTLTNSEVGLVDYNDPADGGWFIGTSSFGNPSTVWNPAVLGVPGGAAPDWADTSTQYQADMDCDVQNGPSHSIPLQASAATGAWSACGYNYMPFSNVIDPQERKKFFVETKLQLGEAEVYGDFLWSELSAEYSASPTYPPTQAGYFYYVPGSNPGYADWVNTQVDPEYQENFASGGMIWGRAKAVSGPSMVAPREHETWRLSGGVRGDVSDSISYDIGFSYSETESETSYRDVVTERYNAALSGFGGANCDADTGTAGEGECRYWNPMYSANTNPALANDDALWDHIWGWSGWKVNKEYLVVDAIFSGDTDIDVGAGTLAWAAGLQHRAYDSESNPWGVWYSEDPLAPTPYHFLAVSTPSESSSDVNAAFAEVRLPIADWAEVNAAVRYEDYDLDSTTNPSLSVALQPTEWLLIRGSYEKSFRVPGAAGNSQTVALIDGEYRLKETINDGSQVPEEANSFNLGFVFTPTDSLRIGLDYYMIELDGPFAVETTSNVLAANDPSQVVRDEEGNIQKVVTHAINGPTTTTKGLDFSASFDIPTDFGVWQMGIEGNYVQTYEIDGYTTPGGVKISSYEAAGNWNVRNANSAYDLWAMPDLKFNAYAGVSAGNHFIRLYGRYISAYDISDDATNVTAFKAYGYGSKIDDWLTWDATYNYIVDSTALAETITVGVSVLNITDEEPPLAPHELAYDPSTHNPLGRVFKATLTVTF